MIELFKELQSLPLSVFLRKSIWAYPLINTLHLLGIALLFGSIAVLDLRLLGAWPRTRLDQLARVLSSTATAGLLLAVSAGALLFLVRAGDYAALWLFQLKMALLVLALANVAIVTISPAWRRVRLGEAAATPALRIAAAMSLLLWFCVLVAGRLVGYA